MSQNIVRAPLNHHLVGSANPRPPLLQRMTTQARVIPANARWNADTAVSERPGRRVGVGVDAPAPRRTVPLAAGALSDNAAQDVAAKLKALASPARVKLISLLISNPAGEECGRVLAASIGLPETTVSHHLRQLRIAGFIQSRRRGMHVFHRMREEALRELSSTLDPRAAHVDDA